MARGYMGKILFADLSKNKLKDEAPDEKLCRQFIGGYGIGARILFSRQKAGVDPLGPDNTWASLAVHLAAPRHFRVQGSLWWGNHR
jgi:aldehyde:ferredoxin oxidoreductase